MRPHEQLDLKLEQTRTLQSPRRAYGLAGRVLFKIFDLVYGKKRTLSKFKVLEITARIPYQAWENVAYLRIGLGYPDPEASRHFHDISLESRRQQDNEQWHLLMLEEITRAKNIGESFLLYRLAPQLLLLVYYPLSWLLYLICPKASYALNADFEDHAEHEYMEFVRENPAFENEPFRSRFGADYGQPSTLAELFRCIAVDERIHKEESLARLCRL